MGRVRNGDGTEELGREVGAETMTARCRRQPKGEEKEQQQ